MRIGWKRTALGVTALAIAGAAVVVAGVVPVRASMEHWPITRWFLSFAMSRSVSTYSLWVDVPRLDDPALVLRGAGHYETGCAPCHGRLGLGRSEIVAETTPEPPFLAAVLSLWSPAELYEIVRHGVKFTSMPAWPAADREDEPWAVVAFLLVMRDLDEEAYLRLAYGPLAADASSIAGGNAPSAALERLSMPMGTPRPDVSEVVRESCGRCHGVDGRGRGLGAFPTLAGQRRAYLENSLAAFASGLRASGMMHPVAASLSADLRTDLASYFAAQGATAELLQTRAPEAETLVALGAEPDESDAPLAGAGEPERGRAIAHRGLPGLEIPSCASCHGPAEHTRNPAYPLLAGQYYRYLVEQLELLREGVRGGTEYVHLMHEAVRGLEGDELRDVAAYYATLGETPR